jgi:hypothetical protein
MPIDVGKFTTEVTVAEGDLPLSSAQIEKLVQILMRRLEEKKRADEQSRDATAIRAHAVPPPLRGR